MREAFDQARPVIIMFVLSALLIGGVPWFLAAEKPEEVSVENAIE